MLPVEQLNNEISYLDPVLELLCLLLEAPEAPFVFFFANTASHLDPPLPASLAVGGSGLEDLVLIIQLDPSS